MSSERYEIVQDDLDALFERVESSLDSLSKKNNLDERKYVAKRCLGLLDEARTLINEMEQEARAAPLSYRSEMLGKVRQYREAVAKLQSDLRKKQDDFMAKSIRFDENEHGQEPLSIDERHRQTVMRGTAVLERTSQSLARSHQVAVETEEVGESIVSDLGVQRETLERSRSMLHETDAELSRSRRILKRLYRGTLYNKVVLLFIIIIELCIVGALVYWKWFS